MAKGKRRRGRRAPIHRNGTKILSSKQRSSSTTHTASRPLHLETLEDRRMLATFVVNNFGDLDSDGNVVVGSLRQAIQEANARNGFDTIIFADFLFENPIGPTGFPLPATIALDGRPAGGQLLISEDDGLEIIGPGPNLLTITAGGRNRVFALNDGNAENSASNQISGLTISGGNPNGDNLGGLGGAIHNVESLTLTEVHVTGNFAPNGGAGVFTLNGQTTIERSLISDNTSETGGGGIQNGNIDQDNNLPTTTILNSTITGNVALGITEDETPNGYGGGVLNQAGTVNIEQSTIYGNEAAIDGGGLGSRGFDPMLDMMTMLPAATSGNATTNIRSSIIAGNAAPNGTDNDVASTGMTEGDDMVPPAPFEPQINSLGYNVFGVLTHPATSLNPAVVLPPNAVDPLDMMTPIDVANVDPTTLFIEDPLVPGEALLGDFGGVLPVFMPDLNKPGADLIVDQGDPNLVNGQLVQGELPIGQLLADNRGYQFSRVAQLPGDVIDEVEPNDAIGLAQMIDLEDWSLNPNPNILNATTVPHLTIIGTGDDSFDYYSFSVASAGDSAVFDIDLGDVFGGPGSADFELFLYDTFGNLLAENNDSDISFGEGGSFSNLDPYLEFTFAAPGTYVIGVGKFDSTGGVGGITGVPVGVDDTYTLQVSVENHPLGPSSSPLFVPRMDIGAAEVQEGNFLVTTLVDEDDGRYSDVPVPEGFFPNIVEVFTPDFSLREALDNAFRNLNAVPNSQTIIRFSELLGDPLDPVDPTLQLELGSLPLTFPVVIEGPTAFELTIDATLNDFTPGINDGLGSSVIDILSTAEISNLVLTGGDEQETGGAVTVFGDATLRQVTIRDNFTTGQGGGIYVAAGNLLLENSTVNANESAGSGAGIFLNGGTTTISNSTISGNTSGLFGGGINNYNGTLLLQYSTVTLNTASAALGSGLTSYRGNSASTEVRSSIISGNTVSDIHHASFGPDSIVSLGYNLVGFGNAVLSGVFSAGGDQSFADAMLAPLARLGGATAVHRLLDGSPAIDAGDPNPAGLGNVPEFDQRGAPFDRVEAGSGSGVIDIGAVENQDGIFFVSVDPITFPGSFPTLSDALNEANISPDSEMIMLVDPGALFTGTWEILDDVEIISAAGATFFLSDFVIDDGDDGNQLDVSFEDFRFETGSRIRSKENLVLENIDFVDNSHVVVDLDFNGIPDDGPGGGAILQEGGMLSITDSSFIGNSAISSLPFLEASGGAIHASGADVTIVNSFLSGNSTGPLGGSGGALYVNDGTLIAENLYITGNSASAATARGGGLYAKNSTVDLANAIISANTTTGSNSEGGGFAAFNSTVVLQNSSLAFNTTTGTSSAGGGLFIDGGSLDVQNGNFIFNETQGNLAPGGGIASKNADVTIDGTTINRNDTQGIDSHGGGIYHTNGNLTITASTISNNDANQTGATGGGIYSNTSPLGGNTALVSNSTVSGNTAASQGGGIHNAGGLLQIEYSTVTDNSVPYSGNGGGVASRGDATASTEVRSSIIAGNLSSFVPGPGDPPNPDSDVDPVGVNPTNSFVSLGFNLIGSGLGLGAFNAAGDQTGIADPGLDPLGFNGGPTQTHALQGGSPAINAGDPNAFGIGSVPMTDQKGDMRVVGTIDIGSFESNVMPVVASTAPTDFDGDGMVTGLDFLRLQANFGTTGATQAQGDSNNDAVVDSADIDNWMGDYGILAITAPLSSAAVAAVSAPVLAPEPEEATLSAIEMQMSTVSETAPIEVPAETGLFERFSIFITNTHFASPELLWNDPFEDLGSELLTGVSEQVEDAFDFVYGEVVSALSQAEGFVEDILGLLDPEEPNGEFDAEDSAFEQMGSVAI